MSNLSKKAAKEVGGFRRLRQRFFKYTKLIHTPKKGITFKAEVAILYISLVTCGYTPFIKNDKIL